VLVTGARGQLGTALQRTCPGGIELVALDRTQLDLGDRAAVLDAIGRARPDLVINAAAYTAVDQAERERDLAFRINAEGAGHVAEGAQRAGARLIQLSTDYVFDGARRTPYRPDDAPNPINVYGASKLAGERAALERTAGAALVVRTAWLYAEAGTNFVNTMLRLLAERDEVRVVNDQAGTPTHASSLARALWRLAALPEVAGIQHWTDAGDTTWCDFAREIRRGAAQRWPARPWATVTPITSAEYPTPARRPPYSVLDTTAACRLLGAASPWQDELAQSLQARRS
jgi:dTDP-4-dehydrorhamnose reductase